MLTQQIYNFFVFLHYILYICDQTTCKMLKSLFSLFLMLTVNAFVFANVALPHHHHNGVPHFFFNSHAGEKHSHEESACCCHHSEEQEESCVFDNDIDLFANNEDTYTINLQENLPTQTLLFCNALFAWDLAFSTEEDSNTSPPYLIRLFDRYVPGSHGLRAPPVVAGCSA